MRIPTAASKHVKERKLRLLKNVVSLFNHKHKSTDFTAAAVHMCHLYDDSLGSLLGNHFATRFSLIPALIHFLPV